MVPVNSHCQVSLTAGRHAALLTGTVTGTVTGAVVVGVELGTVGGVLGVLPGVVPGVVGVVVGAMAGVTVLPPPQAHTLSVMHAAASSLRVVSFMEHWFMSLKAIL
ncbi:hypothetical protein [Massilia sp. PWRC2]|uniref:hypothetical protein n=1 Tax=Massilia sp. PWRC2 TaxID=2804626 RepID=UPI003CEF7500